MPNELSSKTFTLPLGMKPTAYMLDELVRKAKLAAVDEKIKTADWQVTVDTVEENGHQNIVVKVKEW